MSIRKNTKGIDPRYFLNETAYRDLYEGKDTLADWEKRALSKDEVKRDSGGIYYIVPKELAYQASALGAISVQQMPDRGPQGQEMYLVRPGDKSGFPNPFEPAPSNVGVAPPQL